MNKKIECPSCNYLFTAELDSSGMCTCPNCESSLMAIPHEISFEVDYVTDFEECVAEAYTVAEEAHGLDDASLEDEIAHEVTLNDYMKGTFAIFAEMDALGYMAFDTRKMAEGVYVLMHTNTYFGYEQ